MTVHGIGTDIVSVARMQTNWERHGQCFARRVLTAGELEELKKETRPAQFLAKRFAVKEATAKALGTGFREGIRLDEIGVSHDSYGKPKLVLSGRAQALAVEMGIMESHLTLADEQEYAVAFVILLRASA